MAKQHLLNLHVLIRATLLLLGRGKVHSGSQLGKPSRAMVHLFEWNWTDVAQECEEWLGPKGFEAVKLSPATEHRAGPEWWTQYQPVSYNLTSRCGDEAAFSSMVKRCSAAGVAVYADVVINHCAGDSGVGIAGSPYGGRTFPMYGDEDFHHTFDVLTSNCMISNYNNKTEVQMCDLLGMPDICTECERPQKVVGAYLQHLIQLGVSGIRLDAAKHMDAKALGVMLSSAGNLYRYQEVIGSPGEPIHPSDYLQNGAVTEFDYWYQMNALFNNLLHGELNDPIHQINSLGEPTGLLPSERSIIFIDNHDNQRQSTPGGPLTYKDGVDYTLAVAFMLALPYGYPQLMSSYAFTDHDQGPPSEPVHGSGGQLNCGGQLWICEHRQPQIANMVGWRLTAGDDRVSVFERLDQDVIAICRGEAACLVINHRSDRSWSGSLQLSMPRGLYCDVARSDNVTTCSTIKVNHHGVATLEVPAKGMVAIHVKKVLAEYKRSLRI